MRYIYLSKEMYYICVEIEGIYHFFPQKENVRNISMTQKVQGAAACQNWKNVFI